MAIPGVGAHGATLAQQVRFALAERIRRGELAPGTRLKDNELAKLFCTSNTPVREALRELIKDGLVELLPYRGCVVRRIGREELAEVFEVCSVLGPYAARLATGRLAPAQLERLADLAREYDAAATAGNQAAASRAAEEFHWLVAEAAGNDVLIHTLERLANHISVARRTYLPKLRLPTAAFYYGMVEALREGDSERAATVVGEYLACGKQLAVEAMQAAEAAVAAAQVVG